MEVSPLKKSFLSWFCRSVKADGAIQKHVVRSVSPFICQNFVLQQVDETNVFPRFACVRSHESVPVHSSLWDQRNSRRDIGSHLQGLHDLSRGQILGWRGRVAQTGCLDAGQSHKL